MVILELIRIRQWSKNLFIFAPLIFSMHLFESQSFWQTVIAFFLFSLASSSVYILNDLIDIKNDRQHPQKKSRPLPSGKVSPQIALLVFFVLCGVSLAGSFLQDVEFGLLILSYLVVNVLYSIVLKHVVIIDVMVIAASFVLRVLAGAIIVKVYPSNWLLICTILLALFLGFSKRRHELILLTEDAASHRKVLEHYSTYFLDQMISVVTAATVMSYMLYTVSEETVRFFGTRRLILTVPFVLYGIFRYLYLVHQKKEGSDPAEIILKDLPLLLNMILWSFSCVALIYVR
jgi:4-hydroxybenzoate polyprenyltransferase